MSLQYIIDGYNLTNHRLFGSALKKNKDPRIALLGLIREKNLTGSPKNKVLIVFDGYSDPAKFNDARRFPGIEVIFSRAHDADELIKKAVESCANPKNTVVVSDDRQIQSAVRYLGARAIGVEEFLQPPQSRQAKEEETPKSLNYSQMEAINRELKKLWLK